MREFTLLLIQLTVYSSVTACILLLLKRILRFRIPPLLNIILWLVLLIRLVIPVMPESRISVFNMLPGGGEVINDRILTEEYFGIRQDDGSNVDYINRLLAERSEYVLEAGIDLSLVENSISGGDASPNASDRAASAETVHTVLWTAAAAVYICGTAGMLIHLAGAYILAKKHAFRDSRPCESETIREQYLHAARKLHIPPDELPLLRMGQSSMLSGIFSPVLYLNADAREEDIPMIFAHELNHFIHRDNLIILLANIAVCFTWFNPLIWMARNALRDDIEILCDSRTLKLASVKKSDYALLLVQSADVLFKEKPYVSCMSAESSHLKNRLSRIASAEKIPPFTRGLSILLCVSTMAVCLTNPVSSLNNDNSLYIKNASSLCGNIYAPYNADEGISGVHFYNTVYTTLRNRSMENAGRLIYALGDGSLSSFARHAVNTGVAFPGFEEYMSGVAASREINNEQAAVILDTIIKLLSTSSGDETPVVVPVQIREQTLADIVQILPEEEGRALLAAYNRGSMESDIEYAQCYSVETIVRIIQCVENEWLRTKFLAYYNTVPIDQLDGAEYSSVIASTKYDYIYVLQPSTSVKEERTLGEILLLTECGLREDVFYLKPREDLYSYEYIAELYRKAGFDYAEMHDEYAALGFSEYESASDSLRWIRYAEPAGITGNATSAYAKAAVKNICSLGIMTSSEAQPLSVNAPCTFGEAMHILCLLYAGMKPK